MTKTFVILSFFHFFFLLQEESDMEKKPYLRTLGHLPPLSTLDYVLFSLTLAISAIIGAFYGMQDRNKKGAKNFLQASSKMSVFPVSMSLLASFMSAVTLLGTPAEIYNVNTTYMWMVISYFVAIFCAAHIYIPIFYRLRITSIYEVSWNSYNPAFSSMLYTST